MSGEQKWGVESDRYPRKGDIVVIPKGAWLRGTHASLPKNMDNAPILVGVADV